MSERQRDPRKEPKKGDKLRMTGPGGRVWEIAQVTDDVLFYGRDRGRLRPMSYCSLSVWPKLAEKAEVVLVASTLALAVLLVGCTAQNHNYKLMHKPDDGCPRGYMERSYAFLEADGAKLNACVAGPGIETAGDIDELRPGESITVTIPLEAPRQTQ
jgi:hypothetical protein